MSEPVSPPGGASDDRSRAADERAEPASTAAPSGPTGGYAAISIGRWWQGARAASH